MAGYLKSAMCKLDSVSRMQTVLSHKAKAWQHVAQSVHRFARHA
ncbi:hypothetical protein AB9E20_19555 [Rhizobium leguminosarum]|nr:hypothetical protein [Rhizobium leguminosarum]